MAYTALEKMRLCNLERFGKDVGPEQPLLLKGAEYKNDLKSAALRFLHESCEKLLFRPGIERKEQKTGILQGTSLKAGQIPYNMQMDINRLCLERELERFIDSGVAEDAYNVYYCYLEMFFGHYGESKKMVELLSEFESNGSSLLMKHRDHYSHSVYVFALGLAIYETNEPFRRKFREFYGLGQETDANKHEAANLFLQYWGLASLFHDIGYPFELPFEQVISYFEVDNQERGRGSLYLAYHDLEGLTGLKKREKNHFEKLYGRIFENTDDLFAHVITKRLGKSYQFKEAYIKNVIRRKPVAPDQFGYFMDHAYFSSVRLYREMEETLGVGAINEKHMDALAAILLHNSLYKFAISFYKDQEKCKHPLHIEEYPLAYMLMMCDELQCWDRTAYGRNSRTELHPMAADFDFSNNAIRAVYYYDEAERAKIIDFQQQYAAWKKAGDDTKPPRLKAYSDMNEKDQRFRTDIEKIIDTTDMPLTVIPDMKAADHRSKHIYLSNSNFLHLYDFAVALNGRYSYQGTEDIVPVRQLEKEFEALSLEYQLSNINQAKSFGRYLNALRCFYTDRPVDYPMVTAFNAKHAEKIAPMEHARWVKEHRSMGWKAGNDYETISLPESWEAGLKVPEGLSKRKEKEWKKAQEEACRRTLREQFRMHKLAMPDDPTDKEIKQHYLDLPDYEQNKDYAPFNSMLKLIRKFDGLRIYRL